MRSTTQRAMRARLNGGATTWLLLAFLALPVRAQTFVPPIEWALERLGEDEEGADLPSTLTGVHVLLEGATGRELERQFRRVFRVHPQAAMDALVLRAGTPVPPGITAARAGLRQSMRADAAGLLAAEMERSEDARALWTGRLTELLQSDQLVDEDLRSAAIGAIAATRRQDLARQVAVHLDDPVPRFAESARACLFDLYRVRFRSRAEFEEAWAWLAELGDSPPFLRELQAEQERSRELALRLIALSPKEVAAWLGDPDPRIRAQAADALSRFVGEAKVGVPEAIDALLARLEFEPDARAFHALLRNLSDLLASSPPGSPSIVRLRSVLDRVAERRQRDLYGSILRALSRLAWNEDPASGEESLDSGVRRVVELFGRCVDRGRPLDPDLVLTGIGALETLRVRESSTVSWSELTLPAREALEHLLREYRGPEEVRLAIAGAYANLLVDDVEKMLELLAGDHDFVALRYELLGALRRVLPQTDVDDPRARAILETLMRLSEEDEPELRRRSLEVLISKDLRPHVARVGTLADAEKLVERLEYEAEPELRSPLLQLVASFERPPLVDRLLLSPFFDEWTQGGSRNISEMEAALASLAQGDPQVVMRAAERLLVDSKWERQGDSQLVRLESALALVASLSTEAARNLPPEKHATLVRWALELREKGGARLAGTPESAAVLQRLVEVHLPGAGPALERAERAWALLSGDYHLAQPAGISVAEVLARYRAAAARFDATKLEYALLTRDQARFLCRARQPVEAVGAYSNLRGLESAQRSALSADPVALAAWKPLFELSDLRDLARLTAEPAGAEERDLRNAARAAFDLGIELVERISWRREPAKVRIQDLRDLAERAQRSENQPRIAQVRAMFRDLPESPLQGPAPANGEGSELGDSLGELDPTAPLWSGLVRRDDWHRALLDVKIDVLGAQGGGAASGSPPATEAPALSGNEPAGRR